MSSFITATSARSGQSRQDRAYVARRQWSWSRNRSNQRSDNRSVLLDLRLRRFVSRGGGHPRKLPDDALFVSFPFVNDLERNADLFIACLRRDFDTDAFMVGSRGVELGKVA